jgi:GntR family transcriptional regulator
MMAKDRLDRQLDPDSPVPLYHQVKQVIIDAINAGQLEPGDIVPSENTLVEKYRVSRTTIREAMAQLEREGYIHRQRGKYTTVSARPVYHGTSGIAGFSDDMKNQAIKPWSEVLGVSIVCADAQLARRLKIDEGEEVIAINRLRLADGKPVCIESSHLRLARVGTISPRDVDGERSLYRLLRDREGIYLQEVEEVVDVIYADEEDASLLEVPADSPVVRLQRTVYADKNECIEYAVSLWRVDRFKYVAWRSGSSHLAIRDLVPESSDASDTDSQEA